MKRLSVGLISPSARKTTALGASVRSYFWPYNEDFVPKGAATSGFQSSLSPSTRQRILQEYALSPLFGARHPCCTLGTMRSPREMIDLKKEMAHLLCVLAHLKEGSVTLGPLVRTSDMMLFKPGTPLSPRLGDDRRSNANAYGRKSVAARTLVDVFLPEDLADDEVATIGLLVRDKLRRAWIREGTGEFACMGDGSRGKEQAEMLVQRIGIVHCELPPVDEGGFVFDTMGGVPIDGDEAERIVERWDKRCSEAN